MKYTIILTEEINGTFSAMVPNLPKCNIEAQTRQEAIKAIGDKISQIISRSEVIQLDIKAQPKSSNLQEETPWEIFGEFRDDSTWGELFEQIEQRQAIGE
jgi:predicted RNase H-like HicB family nuclease